MGLDWTEPKNITDQQFGKMSVIIVEMHKNLYYFKDKLYYLEGKGLVHPLASNKCSKSGSRWIVTNINDKIEFEWLI